MKALCVKLSLAVLFIAMSLTGIAQEAANPSQENPKPKSMPAEKAAVSSLDKPFMGRLPRFFSSIVNARQRAEIYDIQRVYVLQKQQIEQQLEAIKQAELDAIEQVLNDQQRTQLDEMRSTAASNKPPANKSAAKESQDEDPVENDSKTR